MKLYTWQKKCLEAWRENRYRGIIHVVTGAGKTVFALATIDELKSRYPDVRIRIVVPTIPLANQWKTALMHHMRDETWRPGFFGGGRNDNPDQRVMLYIINSARDSLAGHIRRDLALKRPVFLICDECHHYQSKENRKIFDFLTPAIREGNLYHSLGMSATPFGTANDAVLTSSLGDEIYRYDFNAAAADGVISPFTVCEISASFLPKERKEYVEISDKIGFQLKRLFFYYPHLKGLSESRFMKMVTAIARDTDMDPENPATAFLMLAYQRKKITNLAKARLRCALSLVQSLHDTDRILIFCERISQAEEMLSLLRRQYGNACSLYHSGMTKEARKRILEAFRTGQSRILVSCRCLDEGIDVPDANVGIVFSSSAVARQRVQRLGRVIRRSQDKATACLYYIYIRESSEDAAYLHGLEEADHFGIRYYSEENVFSNDLYEYVAANIVGLARKKGYNQKQLHELRRCLSEGLVRADCFLPVKTVRNYSKAAKDRHECNYWNVMKKVGDEFRKKE